MSKPLISVIMSCYNERLNVLSQAVESILNQTYEMLQFIIIVDNPDNNGLINVLRKYSEKDSRIEIHINKKNIGLAASLNKAIDLAKGEYIARMDADDISLLYRLEEQLYYLQSKKLDITGSWYQYISDDGVKMRVIKEPATNVEKIVKYYCCVGHPTYFVKAECYRKLGGYTDLQECEDYHFLLRARKAGFRIGNYPKICLYYRLSAEGKCRKNAETIETIAWMMSRKCDEINSINNNTILSYLNSIDGKNDKRKVEEYKIASRLSSVFIKISKCIALLPFNSYARYIAKNKIVKMIELGIM